MTVCGFTGNGIQRPIGIISRQQAAGLAMKKKNEGLRRGKELAAYLRPFVNVFSDRISSHCLQKALWSDLL